MTILQRIFKTGTSEAHPSVEELREPIRNTEQGIREMRLELEKSVQMLEAQMKQEESPGASYVVPGNEANSMQTRAELEQKIQMLKTNLRKWEMQLRVLKSRVTVSNATQTINRKMAQLNSPGSLALLENQQEGGAMEGSQVQVMDDNLSGFQGLENATPQTQESCTPQNFTQKADALNEQLGLTPSATAPDAPTTQP